MPARGAREGAGVPGGGGSECVALPTAGDVITLVVLPTVFVVGICGAPSMDEPIGGGKVYLARLGGGLPNIELVV